MKIKRLLPLSLALMLGFFSSCTKDMDDVNPTLQSAASADAKPVATNMMLNLNPNPVIVNQLAVVSVSFNPMPTGGKVFIEKAIDDMGQHTTVALATAWEKVNEVALPSAGAISYNFMPSTIGMFGFRAHYIPSGGSGFSQMQLTKDIQVIAAPVSCSGMALDSKIMSATSLGNDMYEFVVSYQVTSCSDIMDAKLQGGLTSHVTLMDQTAGGDIKETGQSNYVLSWALGTISNGYNKTYTATFRKELKGAGDHTITGDWSVKGKDENGNEVVAGYNNALVYTVN